MKRKILKTSTEQINRDLEALKDKAKVFQSLLDSMTRNGYKPTTEEFRTIVWSKLNNEDKLADYLCSKTLIRHPDINNLPIKEEAKKAMIQLPEGCSSIFSEFVKLPKNPSLLTFIKDYFINDSDILEMTDIAKNSIIDKYSVYGNEKQYEAMLKAKEIVEKIDEFKKIFGVGVFFNGIIQPNMITGECQTNEMAIAINVK